MKLRYVAKEKDGKKVFSHVRVLDTGTDPEQKFTGEFIQEGLAMGFFSFPDMDGETLRAIRRQPLGGQWPEVNSGKLILHAEPEDLVFAIKRGPGRYCLHCGERLHDETRSDLTRGAKLGDAARQHVAEKHAGKPSPDPTEPSGYKWYDHFLVTLAQGQHEMFKA